MISHFYKKISLLILLFPCFLNAQDTDSIDLDFAGFFYLDSVVITAQEQGFDVNEFIEMVQNDQSFYLAFKNSRFISFDAQNDIEMFDKKSRSIASYFSQSQQIYDGECRTMTFSNEDVSGKVYKKQKQKVFKYYTMKMYDRLFFTKGKKCGKNNQNSNIHIDEDAKGMEKYVNQLKKLIFSPGKRIDLPLIADKTEIFSEKMRPFYDYSILSKEYKMDDKVIDCYVFTVQVKDEYKNDKKSTVIRHLETYFSKEDFQVLARDYQVKYFGTLFDFDVFMHIDLTTKNNQYLPTFIQYDGWWNVPLKKKETAKFEILYYY